MYPILSLPIIHYIARRFGWPSLRKSTLDARFKSGRWTHYEEPPEFVNLVERNSGNDKIVVLGCGGNSLGRKLNPAKYCYMIGVDLSLTAILMARKDAPIRQIFFISDMTLWRTKEPVDLVVFSESIYYLPIEKIVPMLDYWRANLTTNGRIIATFAFPERYSKMIKTIGTRYNILEQKCIMPDSKRLALIFN